MNTIDINTTRPVHRFPTVAIIALALVFAAIVALGSETNAPNGGFLGLIGDYCAQVGEALGAG